MLELDLVKTDELLAQNEAFYCLKKLHKKILLINVLPKIAYFSAVPFLRPA